MRNFYLPEPGKPDDRYTWVYSIGTGEYLAGTAGRIRVGLAESVCDALNEFSLCCGEGR
jgi:hypothetical protein